MSSWKVSFLLIVGNEMDADDDLYRIAKVKAPEKIDN